MRHFTGLSALEETLPVGEGLLEAGHRVAPELLREKFEEWLRGRKLIPGEAVLHISEIRNPHSTIRN